MDERKTPMQTASEVLDLCERMLEMIRPMSSHYTKEAYTEIGALIAATASYLHKPVTMVTYEMPPSPDSLMQAVKALRPEGKQICEDADDGN